MKLSEAIKELTRFRKEHYSNLHPYFSEAVDLGIEAGKRIKLGRGIGISRFDALLPGETED